MIKPVVLCDFCEQPIREDEDHILYTHRTKEWDTRLIFPHLCERCASKLDQVILKVKNGETYRRAIMLRNAELNAERRERLSTKG